MGKVLVVFASGLLQDLAERPGRSKIDKEKSAIPRVSLQIILERLSRDMQKARGLTHMRADLFEEPFSTLRLYEPGSLAMLLSNFKKLKLVPETSSFSVSQQTGYLAVFHYGRLNWSLLATYLEIDTQPVLVFLRAAHDPDVLAMFDRADARTAEFDAFFKAAEEAARDALDKPLPQP